MFESIRSLQFLQKRIHFASGITTNNRILSRRICNNAVATDRSLSMRFLAETSLSSITTPRRRTRYASATATITNASTTRLFGSKRGVPGNPLGIVSIYDEQVALKEIDLAALRTTVQRISKILGYETYDVTLLLVDDEEMRETNLESRGIDSPTDILSFPFHECQQNKAGLLEEPEFDVPDYYTLGDLVVDVPYVIRRCKEDLMLHKELEMVGNGSSSESNQEGATSQKTGEEDDFLPVEEEDDRGVSGAMARVQDPEKRIRMLLVHGMLHLVGYDHIEDDDYIEMVEREEDLLKELGEL
jgi:rRNA maturation RNase YbeY